MRKLIVGLVALMLVIILAPWAMGIWFEHSYRQVAASFNAQDDMVVQIQEYHRGWWRSSAVVHVQIKNPDVRKFVEQSGVANAKLDFVLQQDIQHGPLLYRYTKGLPSVFGLASIHNIHSVLNDNDLVTFSGNYFKSFYFMPVSLKAVDNQFHFIFDKGISGGVWFLPAENRMMGNVTLSDFSVTQDNYIVLIPNATLQFDQYRAPSGLWLGSVRLKLPEINVQNNDGSKINIEDLDFYTDNKESGDVIKAFNDLSVGKMDFGVEVLGPLHVQISASDLNANAILNMIAAYQKIQNEGELYQSQLQQKMSAMLPKIISEDSEIKLDSLKLVAPVGRLQISGEMNWPLHLAPASGALLLFQESSAQANMRISQELVNKLIGYISWLPSFRSVSPERHAELIELQKNLEMANQRNFLFISMLVHYGVLSDNNALELLGLQKADASVDEYFRVIKILFLDKKITLMVSHMLFWQYADVKHQIQVLNQALDADQLSIQQQMRNQVEAWVKAGYISKEKNDYVITIQKENDTMKVNGKEL